MPRLPLLSAVLAFALSLPAVAQAAATAAVTPLPPAQERVTPTDAFVLRDDSGTICIDVGPVRVPVRAGDRLTVKCLADDDPARCEVFARTPTMPDGSSVTFDPRSAQDR